MILASHLSLFSLFPVCVFSMLFHRCVSHPSPHHLAFLLVKLILDAYYWYFFLCRFMLLIPWTERELDEQGQNFRLYDQKEIQFSTFLSNCFSLVYVSSFRP